MLNTYEVTGRARTHVIQVEHPRFAAQREVVTAFLELREAAARDGFELEPFSSFRDFKTQLRIWNQKYSGDKPLYTKDGVPRDYSELAEEQIVRSILDWSALPGASRHNWGTEIDVIDRAAVGADYEVQLLPEETMPGGVFYDMHLWLDAHIEDYGFFRPYKRYQGGVYAEPWHLSYAPAALSAINSLSIDLLTEVISEADILGKKVVLELLPEIYDNYVLNYVMPEAQ